jgi:hypothetical protein
MSRRSYGRFDAVPGVSLPFERGEPFALLGVNWCGQDHHDRCARGFPRPSAGRVRVLGLDPLRDRCAVRPRTGVMLQDGGLMGSLNRLRDHAGLAVADGTAAPDRGGHRGGRASTGGWTWGWSSSPAGGPPAGARAGRAGSARGPAPGTSRPPGWTRPRRRTWEGHARAATRRYRTAADGTTWRRPRRSQIVWRSMRAGSVAVTPDDVVWAPLGPDRVPGSGLRVAASSPAARHAHRRQQPGHL